MGPPLFPFFFSFCPPLTLVAVVVVVHELLWRLLPTIHDRLISVFDEEGMGKVFVGGDFALPEEDVGEGVFEDGRGGRREGRRKRRRSST